MSTPEGAKGFQNNFQNRNITIQGNRIDNSFIYGIFVSNADGMRIIDNFIGQTFIRGSFDAGKFYGETQTAAFSSAAQERRNPQQHGRAWSDCENRRGRGSNLRARINPPGKQRAGVTRDGREETAASLERRTCPSRLLRTSGQYKRAQHSYAPHSVCDAASLSPPAGTSGATQITTSTDGQRPCRARLGGGLGVFARLMNHRQLQHGCALALGELRHQHMASVRKFDRIMVAMRNVGVDLAEFSDPEIGDPGPDPPVVVSDVLGERQFGARKQADRNRGLTFRRETAGRSAAECGGDQGFSNLGRTRCYSMQPIVTHFVLLRARDIQPTPLRGAGLYQSEHGILALLLAIVRLPLTETDHKCV